MISVVLCTHNPRLTFLDRTLRALAAQTASLHEWELIVVDNASSTPIAGSIDLTWHVQARVVREPVMGLTMARLCGIRESKGDLIVFVDDDTLLDVDYLTKTAEIARQHARLGCFGAAVIRPEFEVKPDDYYTPYLEYLTIREVPRDHWSNSPADGLVPWGAGLVVRSDVARQYAAVVTTSALRRSLGRAGCSILMSGEDDEFSWVASEMGYGKGIFTSLRLTHLIPKERVSLEYLLKVAEGGAAATEILRHLHGLSADRTPIPRFRLAFSHLTRGRISNGLVALNAALIWRRLSAVERAVGEARVRGRRAAHQLIADSTL